MSITCSIPGCNGRTSLTDETKLYRVPAVAIGSSESSGLIYNLTNERRKKWFEVLESCGLNEDNAASFRVCSNHFRDGKPSPMFDNTSKDWAPSINVPFPENVIEEEEIEVDNNKEKRKRGRPSKREPKRRNSTEGQSPVRSKSVGRSKSVKDIKSCGRSKSVCRSKLLENESNSDQPFVFVDIQKIKEGTPIAFREPTPRPQSPRERVVTAKIKTTGMACRSFGTQTNPNVLPPLHWGRHRSKKQQDPRYQTLGIQTDPVTKLELAVSDNASFQACLGEIIEFVRMQILDYNLNALGNSFKIKECALKFQKEGEEQNHKDKEANTVVVHPTRLLSSNWPLLEAVAMSLDLYRLQQKNEKTTSTGFLRTLIGKNETIEKMSDILAENDPWRNPVREIEKSNENPLAEIIINDDENGNHSGIESPFSSRDKDPVISPVLPRITSVISIGELLKDSTSAKSPAKQSAARKKLAKVSVPSPQSMPTITRLTPKNSLAGRKKSGTNVVSVRKRKKIPYITNKRRMKIEGNTAVQSILGTTKVPRVVLSKLPDSVFKNGGRVILGTTNTAFGDAKSQRIPGSFNQSPQLLWVPGVSGDGNSLSNVSLTNEVKNTSLSFKTVKNIPLKLSQTPGVAGYLLLPNPSTVGGTTPIMYVPKPDVKNLYPDQDSNNQNINFEEFVRNGTLVLPGSTSGTQHNDSSNAVSNPLQDVSSQSMAPASIHNDTSTSRLLHVSEPKITKVTEPKIRKVAEPKITKVAIPNLPRKRGSPKKPKVPRKRKKIFDEDDWQEYTGLVPQEKNLSTPFQVELSPNQMIGDSPNDEEALLRCPYCLKNCKDGLDFINHHKTTGCKGKKNAVPVHMTKCKRCKVLYRTGVNHKCKKRTATDNFHDCNVCGKVFVKAAQLDVHLITHVEYEVWNQLCTDCPKKFATSEELEDHALDRHSWKVKIAKFECEKCEKRFTTRKRLECHVEKKHPANVMKKCSIRIRCKFCRDIFELEHYRQIHWKDCQEKRRQQDNKAIIETIKYGLDENISAEKMNDKVKITKANRESIKVKVTTRDTEEDNWMKTSIKIEKPEYPEEIPKKPTAIRSRIIVKKEHTNDDLEAQLSKMFQEDTSDSSPSEYEHEELLNEDFADAITSNKIENEVGERNEEDDLMKRLMNISDFEVPTAKMSKKIEEIKREDDEMVDKHLYKESEILENDTKKIDIKSLLNIDDSTNDIVIEEIEDDEYFSMDELTH